MNNNRTFFQFALLVCCLLSLVVAKKNYDKPHPHGPILTPYHPGPFESLKLNKSDEKKLAEGKAVMKQSMPDPNSDDPAGGAICVQDIQAPREAVWSQILDLDNYTKKVPKLSESKNYKVESKKDGCFQIKTKMVMNVMPGYKVCLLGVYWYDEACFLLKIICMKVDFCRV